MKKKIIHIVAGLPNGGAEAVLFNLLQGSTETNNIVISLGGKGFYGEKFKQLEVKLFCLKMKPSHFSLTAFIRLIRILRQEKPDVVQTWLYHANLLGGIAAKIARIKNVFWSIHQTELTPAETKLFIFIVKLGAKLSPWFAKKIIYCANRACTNHEKMGYNKSKSVIIFNGYDANRFQPNPIAKKQIRQELNIDHNEKLIGLIARFHPEKDHNTFIQAAKQIKKSIPKSKFLLCGTDITTENKALMTLIKQAKIEQNCLLLRERQDIEKIIATLDLHILSSLSEAFPNVICESMLCGVPCVSTDVGDAAFIMQETGKVVPTENSQKLAQAAIELLQLEKNKQIKLKQKVRQRIKDKFTVSLMIKNYHHHYNSI